MATRTQQGFVDAIKYDLQLLHQTWMGLFYPRQRGAEDTVLGRYVPEENPGRAIYRLTYALGVPLVGLLYPLLLTGYFVRFQARKLNVTAARLGIVGVVGVFVLLWGGLVAVIWFQFSETFSRLEIIAIGASGAVAVLSSALSYGFWRLGGRGSTVLLAYPLAVTAIFLPPIVAAVLHPALEDLIIAQSDELARDLYFASPQVVQDELGQFERQPRHHVIIWFVFSFPIGWVFGSLVTLADLIRPTSD